MRLLFIAPALLTTTLAAQLLAAEGPASLPPLPAGVYYAHDQARPTPPVIAAGGNDSGPVQPPSDAIVLFDGTNLDAWSRMKPVTRPDGTSDDMPTWRIDRGELVVAPKTDSIRTRRAFPSSQVHIEWATPAEVVHRGQARGNSGVFLTGFNEIQVLDSFDNHCEPDSQAGALYGRKPPRVNASRKPGEWQTFDIVAELATFGPKGQVERPARLTVLHNGVLVQHAVEMRAPVREITLGLQDHHVPVRFRNIWIRPLGPEPTDAVKPPEPPTAPPPAPTKAP
jgi:hypothetical protein